MGKINKDWHLANKMPNPPAGGPTKEQRLNWHIEHSKNCTCREMPQKLIDEIKDFKQI